MYAYIWLFRRTFLWKIILVYSKTPQSTFRPREIKFHCPRANSYFRLRIMNELERNAPGKFMRLHG